MQTAFLFLTLFAVHAMAAEIESVAKESVQEFEKDAKNRPVSKVIALLKDMVKQLEKEGEDDEKFMRPWVAGVSPMTRPRQNPLLMLRQRLRR
jgi:hypothetical protein